MRTTSSLQRIITTRLDVVVRWTERRRGSVEALDAAARLDATRAFLVVAEELWWRVAVEPPGQRESLASAARCDFSHLQAVGMKLAIAEEERHLVVRLGRHLEEHERVKHWHQ